MHTCRLPGIIGPVPPPSLDKSFLYDRVAHVRRVFGHRQLALRHLMIVRGLLVVNHLTKSFFGIEYELLSSAYWYLLDSPNLS